MIFHPDECRCQYLWIYHTADDNSFIDETRAAFVNNIPTYT